jgi:glycosyltransferase involved in cell wall biosynthesis
MRVLLIAEQCNPEWVSVPLVGWSHSRAIAAKVDAHLVTQVRNRDAILRAGLREGIDFTAINSEAIEARIYRLASRLRGGSNKGWTLVTGLAALSYPYFEHLIWRQFGSRIRAGEFDVVHRITPLSPTTPSQLAPKCREAGVPFVLGPLNGGVPWPKHFDSARRKEKEWLSYVRDAYKLLPGYLSTRGSSSAILIGSRDTWRQMPRSYQSKSIYLPENAIDPARFAKRRARHAGCPIRCVFIGRLVPYKGADMLLEAAAPLIREGKLTVDIIGDGPQMSDLKALVSREKIEAGVTLAGWVEHGKLQDRLIERDLFTFPSIREFGGGVALEAMAVGVPPVVIDYGGPAELVTDRTGWLLPMGSRAQIVDRLRALLGALADRPEQIDVKSIAAYERARGLFTWDAKAGQVMAVYRWVLDPASPKPDFGMPLPESDPKL